MPVDRGKGIVSGAPGRSAHRRGETALAAGFTEGDLRSMEPGPDPAARMDPTARLQPNRGNPTR